MRSVHTQVVGSLFTNYTLWLIIIVKPAFYTKFQRLNSVEYNNSCINNFLHLNLSFQQLESQFSILELWM